MMVQTLAGYSKLQEFPLVASTVATLVFSVLDLFCSQLLSYMLKVSFHEICCRTSSSSCTT